jgi:hypothetical protein
VIEREWGEEGELGKEEEREEGGRKVREEDDVRGYPVPKGGRPALSGERGIWSCM